MHKSKTGKEYWDNIKEDIIDLYANKGWSTTKIGEKYNCYGSTIANKNPNQ